MMVLDPLAVLSHALAGHSMAAPALAFTVGVITAVSPCVAIRVAAMRSLLSGTPGKRRLSVAGAFIAGLLCACMVITSSVSLWSRVAAASPWIYCILASGLAWVGLRALTTAGASHDGCASPHAASHGWAFVNGASLALVPSPCCTPVLASVAGLAMLNATHWLGLATALCFAAGHVAPLLPAATGLPAPRAVQGKNWKVASEIVSGGVLVSLGAYYAFLA